MRLYSSALAGVIYVYGRPVRFDRRPKVIAEREAAKADKQAQIDAREARQ